MLPLSHLGIGSAMARPFSKNLPFRWLLVGTLLPDLIDKPVFFALGLLEYFRNGGWIPGKRGFAHTALFLCLLASVSLWTKSARWVCRDARNGDSLTTGRYFEDVRNAPHCFRNLNRFLLAVPRLAFSNLVVRTTRRRGAHMRSRWGRTAIAPASCEAV